MTCKSGAPILDGGSSSNILEKLLLTSSTIKEFSTHQLKTKKDNQLEFGTIMVVSTKDGEWFILINPRKKKLQE